VTNRLREALERRAGEQHRNLHQILFYALSRDLIELTMNRGAARNLIPAKEILSLEAEYATAEHEAMRAANQKVLKPCQRGSGG
jgi:hypothetical protein